MKLYSVQYLRGLAAVLVLIAHALQMSSAVVTFDQIRLGRLGVLMFFVISGFIMVLISGEDRFDPLTFLKRRVVRIVPLYWLATFAVALLAIAAPALFKNTAFTVPHLILSLLFVPHASPGGDPVPILKLGWTLNYEMFFYLCFAGLAFLTAGRRIALLSAIFLVLAVIGIVFQPTQVVANYYTSFFITAFCIGGWVGYVTLKGWRFGVTIPQAALLVAIAVASFAVAFGFEHGEKGGEVVAAAMTIGSTALLLLGIARESSTVHSPLLAKLGDASFSIYLSHIYVVGAVTAIGRKLLGDAGFPLMVGGSIIGGVIVGVAIYELIERPLTRRLQRPARAPKPAAHPAVPIPRDGTPPGDLR